MVAAESCDLREVRYAKKLVLPCDIGELARHVHCDFPAYVRIYLIENEHRCGVNFRENGFECEHHSRGFAC